MLRYVALLFHVIAAFSCYVAMLHYYVTLFVRCCVTLLRYVVVLRCYVTLLCYVDICYVVMLLCYVVVTLCYIIIIRCCYVVNVALLCYIVCTLLCYAIHHATVVVVVELKGMKASARFRESIANIRLRHQPPHIKYPLLALHIVSNPEAYIARQLNVKEEVRYSL